MTDTEDMIRELRAIAGGTTIVRIVRAAANALEGLTVERDAIAAVIEKLGIVAKDCPSVASVDEILDASPADALRAVKAQAWDDGFDAGRDDLGAAQAAIEHGEDENPYRKERADD